MRHVLFAFASLALAAVVALLVGSAGGGAFVSAALANLTVVTWSSFVLPLRGLPRFDEYFELRAWERSGRLYRALGVEGFRLLVRRGPLSIFNHALPAAWHSGDPERIEHEARTSEAGHVVAFLIVLALALVAVVRGELAQAAWLAALDDHTAFDVVVSGYAIHHLPDARKHDLYAEIFNLLTPGGVFVNVEHVASRSAWIEAISGTLMVDSLYAFHTRQDSNQTRAQVAEEFVHRPDKAANILAPVEVQCGWLRDAGFVDVDCYFKAFKLAVFGGRRPPVPAL